TIFNLINFDTSSGHHEQFNIWPIYFSRDTGVEETSYRAVFPIYGDITQRFSQDRMSWVLFPLYGRFENRGETTTTVPWPFLKLVSGEDRHGVELWPLAGQRGHEGVYSDKFLLWPLIYRKETGLNTDTPSLKAGVLPFYALDRAPGY